eukprot:5812167-Pleurochrysis_carterae.AAC.3
MNVRRAAKVVRKTRAGPSSERMGPRTNKTSPDHNDELRPIPQFPLEREISSSVQTHAILGVTCAGDAEGRRSSAREGEFSREGTDGILADAVKHVSRSARVRRKQARCRGVLFISEGGSQGACTLDD